MLCVTHRVAVTCHVIHRVVVRCHVTYKIATECHAHKSNGFTNFRIVIEMYILFM